MEKIWIFRHRNIAPQWMLLSQKSRNKHGITIKSYNGAPLMQRRVGLVGWVFIMLLCQKYIFLAGDLDDSLSDSVRQALKNSRRITRLYTHQAAAINAIARGKNVIVSTSTASGKSAIYQVCIHYSTRHV
jgi:superfamily II DNA/RNA helicase